MIDRVEVEHGKVGDHARQAMVALHPLGQLGGTVVTETADHVDLGHKHVCVVLGDEETGGVIDGVAGATAHTEQLRLGAIPRADVGDVGVAEPVDLAGAHHHMTTAAPQRVEHAAKRNPTFDDLVGATNWQFVTHIKRLAVADHQVGLEGAARCASAEHWNGAHAAGEDLAVATECLGGGDDHDVSKSAHDCAFHSATAA